MAGSLDPTNIPVSSLPPDQLTVLKRLKKEGITKRQVGDRWICVNVAMRRVGDATLPCVCGAVLLDQYDESGNKIKSFCPYCDTPPENPNPKVSTQGDISQEQFDKEEAARKAQKLADLQELMGDQVPLTEATPPKETKPMTTPAANAVTVTYDLSDLMMDVQKAKGGEDLALFAKLTEALDNLPFSTMKDAKTVMALQDGLVQIQALLKKAVPVDRT